MDGRQEHKQQLQNVLWPLPAPREPSPRRVLAGLGGGQRAPRRGDMASARTRHLLRGIPPTVPLPAPAPPRSPSRPLFTPLTAQVAVCRSKCFLSISSKRVPSESGERGRGTGTAVDAAAAQRSLTQPGAVPPPHETSGRDRL